MAEITLPSGPVAGGGGSSWGFSESESKQYSGLPPLWRKRALRFLAPRLRKYIDDWEGTIDNWANEGLKKYQYQLNQALRTAMPSVVGNLANKGVLSSTVAGNAIGDVSKHFADQMGSQSYDTLMKAMQMKSQIPMALAQMFGNFGKYSEGNAWSKSEQGSENSYYDNGALYGMLGYL